MKIQRRSGVRYKALIKREGRVMKSRTFDTKTHAREWAKRNEADRELLDAFGMPGASMTLSECAWEFLTQPETKAAPSNVK